ncbi:MAG: anthranilate phosphoribosyltransferase [Thermodesulfobacteriota bacterium]
MIREAIDKAVRREDLTDEEMTQAMTEIAEGRATAAQIAALLVALRMKGETVVEITAAARFMRNRCPRIPLDPVRAAWCGTPLIVDTCGTGGDSSHTFNVSTTAAFVVAGTGLTVAKHGNRSVSSRCGSADLVEALGVNLDLDPEDVGACLDRLGIGFLFAPRLHGAMRHAVGPRREMGLRTIFNLVGPLTNPAGATVQVLGVYQAELTETLASALDRLGCLSALVVHGQGGYDEISITGPTRLTRLYRGSITTFTLTPEEAGLRRAGAEEVLGGPPARNAAITRAVLEGKKGPCRDMTLLNAAAALVAAGLARDFGQGVRLAAEAVDSGEALVKLENLAALTQDLARRPRAAEG